MGKFPQPAAATMDVSPDDKLKALVESTDIEPEELEGCKACLRMLNSIVHHLGPDWYIKPFGSSANGFGRKGSDLDVTCFLAGIGEQDRPFAIQELQTRLVPLLERHPQFELIEAVWSARVPILKMRFNGWLEVDLSCQNTEAILNTELLKAYARIHPAVKHLVVCVKLWAKAQGVSGAKAGHLSSYTLSLMSIYFMQVHPSLQLPCVPTLEFSLERPSPIFDFSGWRCPMTGAELLSRFFYFFANEFQWGTEVVSIRLGYRAQIASPEFAALSGHPFAWRLHIEDPFLLHRNLNCVLGDDQEVVLRSSISSASWDMSNWQIPQALQQGQLDFGTVTVKPTLQRPSQSRQHQALRESPQSNVSINKESDAEVVADKAKSVASNKRVIAPDPSTVPIPKLATFAF
eukprot:TRINITY_DN4243_c0_g1_i4.p1 TRINITY_DN4243_c0_g1~~TRINITY_DN4243_c0_g1_i4.p1  ORF type:complete len:404 (-),score=67.94 TRINITY_DN4243_c0_g1_i4:104-1315(-)